MSSRCELEVIQKGDGRTYPKKGQTVVVHYTGRLPNGQVFDCSRDRKKHFKFVLGKSQVLKGWEEGIKKMSIGERVKLVCPPEMAYGKQGYPGAIPPNATLVFDIELIALE